MRNPDSICLQVYLQLAILTFHQKLLDGADPDLRGKYLLVLLNKSDPCVNKFVMSLPGIHIGPILVPNDYIYNSHLSETTVILVSLFSTKIIINLTVAEQEWLCL